MPLFSEKKGRYLYILLFTKCQSQKGVISVLKSRCPEELRLEGRSLCSTLLRTDLVRSLCLRPCQSDFYYLHAWRFHSLSGQPVLIFVHVVKERILACNQSFSCSNLSAASCDVTVDLKEESGSIFSRQLYIPVRSPGLLWAEETHISQPCLVPHVLQPHSISLQYICVFLVLWSSNLDIELKMSCQVVKICIKRW